VPASATRRREPPPDRGRPASCAPSAHARQFIQALLNPCLGVNQSFSRVTHLSCSLPNARQSRSPMLRRPRHFCVCQKCSRRSGGQRTLWRTVGRHRPRRSGAPRTRRTGARRTAHGSISGRMPDWLAWPVSTSGHLVWSRKPGNHLGDQLDGLGRRDAAEAPMRCAPRSARADGPPGRASR
jgi:hypothetical protein